MATFNTDTVRKDCFAYTSKGCTALNDTYCGFKKGECSFYKSKQGVMGNEETDGEPSGVPTPNQKDKEQPVQTS